MEEEGKHLEREKEIIRKIGNGEDKRRIKKMSEGNRQWRL